MEHADFAPLLDKGAISGELHDAGGFAIGATFGHGLIGNHALCVVAVRNINAAIRAYDYIVWLVEMAGVIAGLTGSAQAH